MERLPPSRDGWTYSVPLIFSLPAYLSIARVPRVDPYAMSGACVGLEIASEALKKLSLLEKNSVFDTIAQQCPSW
jgi:hypothetical protein